MAVKFLTPKQKKVLKYIQSFIGEKGYSPSLNEIAKYFDKSIPTIHQYIEALTEKGFLEREEHAVRGMRLATAESKKIFLLGEIAAGEPIEPLENPEPIEAPFSMTVTPGNYYALKVNGDSMINEGILDGDIIVVRHQKVAENGDIVVAITEHGATLKTLKKDNDKIYLEPRNKKLANIYPQQLEIRGKFMGLIRKE